ncbi:MAG: hypothetical protein AB8H03_13245, partial [Saprospiraceae bacterium]
MTISLTSILCTIRSCSFLRNLLRSSKVRWILCIGFLLFAQLSSSQCTDPVISPDTSPGTCLNGLNLKASGGYTSYRWFLDGTEIYGEIDSILNTYFYGNGDYRVIGTGGICAPSDTSAIYNILCEICGNNIDDDGDTFTDCDDPDCSDYNGCTDCDNDGVVDNEDYCFCDASLLLSLNTYGCGFPDSCEFKVSDIVTIDTSGVNYDPNYITTYILADSTGEIVDISMTPEFAITIPGKYMITAINYEDDGSILNLAVGNDLNTVTANCYDISNALTLKVCPEEDCSDGIDNDDDGLVDCDDPDCAPTAGIIANIISGCVNDNFSFISDSIIVGANYSWTFGSGASPATATGVGSHTVIYSTCGNKEIILNVLENGCTVSDTIYVDVIDLVNPTFTVPSDVTVSLDNSCAMDTIPASIGIPTGVSDNCTTSPIVTYTNDFTNLNQCSSTGSFDRIWTVTDNCGNTDVFVQVINVEDTTDPVISSSLSDITVECDAIPAGDISTASATDN